jgi:hypothetical protein
LRCERRKWATCYYIGRAEPDPLQFAWRVNQRLLPSPTGSAAADYAWRFATTLDGFDARLTRAWQHCLFSGWRGKPGEHHEPRLALVSHLDLRGVGFEPGMVFVRRYLEAMRWTP